MGKTTPDFIRDAMGVHWCKWFQDRSPVAEDVVPAQVCILLAQSLDRIKAHWMTALAKTKAARALTEQFDAMQLSAKRRKEDLEHYDDEDMEV